jgi:hypothetical protein
MKRYYIIIRDDLNHGEEINRSDFFDNEDDAIAWGKDHVDYQGWYWVLEEYND